MTDTPKLSDPIELDDPIIRGEQTIASLKLRLPRSGELRGLSMVDIVKLEVDTLHQLLPRITMPALTVEEASNLSPADLFSLAGEVANFFLPKGLKEASPQT